MSISPYMSFTCLWEPVSCSLQAGGSSLHSLTVLIGKAGAPCLHLCSGQAAERERALSRLYCVHGMPFGFTRVASISGKDRILTSW